MAIFNSYVKLPEGSYYEIMSCNYNFKSYNWAKKVFWPSRLGLHGITIPQT